MLDSLDWFLRLYRIDNVELTSEMVSQGVLELKIYEISESISFLFNQLQFIINSFCCSLVIMDNNSSNPMSNLFTDFWR